jgi:hypothetical protein
MVTANLDHIVHRDEQLDGKMPEIIVCTSTYVCQLTCSWLHVLLFTDLLYSMVELSH